MMNYELLGILLTVVIQGLYVAYKMGRLEEKIVNLKQTQDKHNQVVERTYKNECEIKVLKEQVRVGNHRINDLEEVHK